MKKQLTKNVMWWEDLIIAAAESVWVGVGIKIPMDLSFFIPDSGVMLPVPSAP